MALIFALSSRSEAPSAPLLSDTIAAVLGHFALYAVLAVLLLLGLRSWRPRQSISPYVLAGVIAIIYAISDEFHQSFVPGRDASALDLAVDALGVMSALALMRLLGVRTGRRVAR